MSIRVKKFRNHAVIVNIGEREVFIKENNCVPYLKQSYYSRTDKLCVISLLIYALSHRKD
jgi:hypothetical protein